MLRPSLKGISFGRSCHDDYSISTPGSAVMNSRCNMNRQQLK